MKPILLTINAFGPYVEKTVIDFEKLGTDGLYLVTGDTGAGKTTIFDAICFVLYGSASGSSRNSRSLRSDFAKDDNKTFVKMEFINKGEKYEIIRYCGYDKITAKGAVSKERESAILTLPNGISLSNLKEVNQEIESILGLTKEQFSQIVMIAQGEFQKLLLASTKDRMTIFRRIFRTYSFEKFQIELKNRFLDSKNEVSAYKESIFQYIRDISENPENKALIEEKESVLLKNNIYEIKTLLELVTEFNKVDEDELANLKKQLEKKQAEKDKLQQELKLAEMVANAQKELDELNKNLPEQEENAKNFNKLYLEEKNKDKERTDLNTKIKKLESDLDKYKHLDELNKKLTLKKAENVYKEEKLKEKQESFSRQNKKYLSDKKEIEKYVNIDVELTKNELKQKENIENKTKLDEVETILSEYKKEKDKLEIKQEDLKKAQDEYIQTQKLADETFVKYTSNLAGILAQNLKADGMCPVCGSTSHPKKAKLSKDSVTKEDYEKTKSDAEKKQQENLQLATVVSEMKSSVQSKEKTLLKDAKNLFKMKVIEGLEEKIEDALDENKKEADFLKKECVELEKTVAERNALSKSIKTFEENREKFEDEMKQLENDSKELLITIKGLETSISEQDKSLESKDEKEAKATLLEYKSKIDEMMKKLADLEKENEISQKILTETKTQIKEKTKIIKDNKAQDFDALNSKNSALEEEIKAITTSNSVIYHRIETNKKVLDSIKTQSADFEKSSEKCQILENLSATANGTLNGKMKLSFENFILAKCFDNIIYAANKRFKNMTSGQFELRRNNEKGGNGQTGLDLDVFDAYTTKTRDVSTLSGGESFKAALSLALGLSDIIQQQAGGISVDTMFIDEGFGSLDNESLEQTMKILFELSGYNTLIGIISHVAELREKIERKIVVKKTQSGSSLSVFAP